MTTKTKMFVPSIRDREAALRIMKVSESDCYARLTSYAGVPVSEIGPY